MYSDEEMDDVYAVEEIRGVRGKNPGTRQFLVKWEGYEEETWEPESHILNDTLIQEFYKRQEAAAASKKSKKVSGTSAEPKATQQSAKVPKPERKRKRIKVDPSAWDTNKDRESISDEILVLDGPVEGLEPSAIIGATKVDGEIIFLIRWENDVHKPSTVYAKDANLKWPSLVIQFYEKHFEWSRKGAD